MRFMAQIHPHNRYASDSSLLVSCLQHSGVLPADTTAHSRHSSIPVPYEGLQQPSMAPIAIEQFVLATNTSQESLPTIVLTSPVIEESALDIPSGSFGREEKEKGSENGDVGGIALAIPSLNRQKRISLNRRSEEEVGYIRMPLRGESNLSSQASAEDGNGSRSRR